MRSVSLLGLAALTLLASSAATADTYIFVTNSTPDPVTISVNHYGTDTMTPGDEWAQEETTIPPYGTRRVLRYNRYWGVHSGETFYFDTVVSNGTSSVTLKQRMVGTWSGSNIVHGASGSDFSSPWYSDRNIHTFSTTYGGRSSVNSFKAQLTGGYDDFYYTIHNNTPTEAVSGTDQLKVLTYNIWALPLVASDIGARLAELPNHLDGYDAILLQEAFASDRDDFLLAMASEYPYQTHIPRIPFELGTFNIFDSGVAILSRYPIVATADFIYPDCSGTDCFADKGVIYAEIIKGGKAYHLTSTHTASFDTTEARTLRQEQFLQIRDLVDDQSIPSTDAVLMGGDFNVNKLLWPTDYAQMLTNLNATDPVSTGYTEATFDPRVNENAGAAGSGGTTVEYLDYVVYANDHRQPTTSRNDVRVLRSVASSVWGTWDLSDHFPVMGEFDFNTAP
jgi:endonuclease/exonuclease/phosphatase family metal-dependent hydrolase